MEQEHREDMTAFQEKLLTEKKSMLRLYQDMFLGSTALSYLIYNECSQLLASQVPGALGLFLRKLLYPRLFSHIGRNVMFGKNLTLRHAIKIRIGENVAIDDNIILDAKGLANEKEFTLGNNIILGHTSTFCSKGGSLIISDNCNFGSHVAIYSASDILFGKNCLVGPGTFVGGGTYKFDSLDKPIIGQGYDLKGAISIGDNCWFGAKVTVVDGVSIGKNCIIGAGAVVLEHIPDNTIAAGVPAKVLRKR